MKGKLLMVFLFLFFCLVFSAIAEAKFEKNGEQKLIEFNDINPQQIGHMEADIKFTATLTSSEKIERINHSLYILPEEYSDLKVSTDYSIVNDAYGNKMLVLHWNDFTSDTYEVTLHTSNSAKLSGAKKLSYPYKIPGEMGLINYVVETNKSVITDEIRQKTKELVEDSENAFDVVTLLSHWIYTNVKYDIALSSEIKDSAWVFENKRGTCDEFATLFISMARSAGIPARYVAGVTYTEGSWGYHGWAEVYLDGWVPVDPTWDEIGWIDATHIALGKFLDSGDVVMKSSYVTYKTTTLQMEMPSVNVLNPEYSEIEKIFLTEHETFPNEIGFGDSAVLEIRTSVLPETGCVATSIEVVPRVDNRGLAIVDVRGEKVISVCPGEESKIHFVMKSRGDLSTKFQYYSLADIYTFLGEKVTVNLTVSPTEIKQSFLDLILDSASILKGGDLGYNVVSDGNYKLFSDLDFTDEYITADKTGSHYIIAASETGEVVKKDFDVKRVLGFVVKNIRKPEKNLDCGENFNISFDIENFEDTKIFNIETVVTNGLEDIEPVSITLNKDKKETVTLYSKVDENCTSEDQLVSIIVRDDVIYEKIGVEKKTQLDFFTLLGQAILGFFAAIGNSILSLFGAI